MSNYTKATDFAAKDSLPSGNAAKVVKGTEIDDEFAAIQTAIATKADTSSIDYKNRIVSYNHVVKASDTTVSNSTFTDLSMDVTLTPDSASNKILIIANVKTYHRQVDDSGVELALYIDGTNTIEWSHDFYSSSNSVDTGGLGGMATFIYEHTPGATSEITYSVYGRNTFAGFAEFHGTESTITVMEIEV